MPQVIILQADLCSFDLRILSALYQQKFNQRRILFVNLISTKFFLYLGLTNPNDVKITNKIKRYKIKLI